MLRLQNNQLKQDVDGNLFSQTMQSSQPCAQQKQLLETTNQLKHIFIRLEFQ